MKVTILIFVFLILFSFILFIAKFKKRPKQKPITDQTIFTTSNSYDREYFPPIKITENNDFILNPNAPFELTLQNATLDIANKIRDILDYDNFHNKTKEETIAALFAEHNLKVKEIEAYKKKYGIIYKAKIEELKNSSEEWNISSEKDKEDILEEFKQLAIKEIYEKASCDLITLFENEPKDLTIDDELIKEYGYENIEVYLRFAFDLEKVRIIPNDNYFRKKFEKLVEIGLANRGSNIPKELILTTLTLKELNEIAINADKQFKRKNQAVEYVLKLPNLDEVLGKYISFRELFKLIPLPSKYSQINLKELSKTWTYTNEVVNMLVNTYQQSYLSYSTLKRDKKYVKEYKVYCYDEIEDMCPCAKDLISKVYPKSNPPIIPFHIGCNCSLQEEY